MSEPTVPAVREDELRAEWLRRAEGMREEAERCREYADFLRSDEAKATPDDHKFGTPESSEADADSHEAEALLYEQTAAALDARVPDSRDEAWARKVAGAAVQILADSEPDGPCIEAQDRLQGTDAESYFVVSAETLEDIVHCAISDQLYDDQRFATPDSRRVEGLGLVTFDEVVEQCRRQHEHIEKLETRCIALEDAKGAELRWLRNRVGVLQGRTVREFREDIQGIIDERIAATPDSEPSGDVPADARRFRELAVKRGYRIEELREQHDTYIAALKANDRWPPRIEMRTAAPVPATGMETSDNE